MQNPFLSQAFEFLKAVSHLFIYWLVAKAYVESLRAMNIVELLVLAHLFDKVARPRPSKVTFTYSLRVKLLPV